MVNFKAVIYTAGNTIFVPTTRTVKQPYENGDYGDQLWEQILEGRMTGNLWTEKEIESLSPVMKNLDVIVR